MGCTSPDMVTSVSQSISFVFTSWKDTCFPCSVQLPLKSCFGTKSEISCFSVILAQRLCSFQVQLAPGSALFHPLTLLQPATPESECSSVLASAQSQVKCGLGHSHAEVDSSCCAVEISRAASGLHGEGRGRRGSVCTSNLRRRREEVVTSSCLSLRTLTSSKITRSPAA